MKSLIRILVIFCFGLIISLDSYAQTEVGAYVGLSSTNLKGDKPKDSKYLPKTGVIVGINIDIPLGKNFFLSLQPGFATGGTRVAFANYDTNEYEDSITIKLNNFVLPVLFKVTSLSPKLYFTGGFDFLFPAQSTATIDDVSIDIDEEVNDFQVAMVFGLGYRIPIKKSDLCIEFRYEQGLINISEAPDPDLTYIPRVKPTALRLIAGWQIPIKKSK